MDRMNVEHLCIYDESIFINRILVTSLDNFRDKNHQTNDSCCDSHDQYGAGQKIFYSFDTFVILRGYGI